MDSDLDYNKIKDLVWRTINGMPIEIFDDENFAVWENSVWELTVARDYSQGDFHGTRIIGSANILIAYNIVRLKSFKEAFDNQKDIALYSLEVFRKVLELLEQDKLIRKKPSNLRKTFKVV
jgi:hypothetical protein